MLENKPSALSKAIECTEYTVMIGAVTIAMIALIDWLGVIAGLVVWVPVMYAIVTE